MLFQATRAVEMTDSWDIYEGVKREKQGIAAQNAAPYIQPIASPMPNLGYLPPLPVDNRPPVPSSARPNLPLPTMLMPPGQMISESRFHTMDEGSSMSSKHIPALVAAAPQSFYHGDNPNYESENTVEEVSGFDRDDDPALLPPVIASLQTYAQR